MSFDPVALFKRYHDALNHYDARTVKEMFAADATYDSPGVKGLIVGREAIIAAFTAYFDEHPDQQGMDEEITAIAPDCVRSVWRLEATRRSTGQRVTRRGTQTVTFGPDGLITHVQVTDE